jgi:hypothetical protein
MRSISLYIVQEAGGPDKQNWAPLFPNAYRHLASRSGETGAGFEAKAPERYVMSEHPKSDEVRIHINRESYESPNPTTGEALYVLGNVPKHQELFREIGGDAEDQPLPRDGTVVHLTKDEHFYSQKTITIVVNGTPYDVPKKEKITYAEVVTLAYPDYPQHPEITYSVTYERGHSDKHEGILPPGGSIKVKEGMAFRVNRTGQS